MFTVDLMEIQEDYVYQGTLSLLSCPHTLDVSFQPELVTVPSNIIKKLVKELKDV